MTSSEGQSDAVWIGRVVPAEAWNFFKMVTGVLMVSISTIFSLNSHSVWEYGLLVDIHMSYIPSIS